MLAECAVLWWAQRHLFWLVKDALGSRVLAYAVAAPGTVLHELAHYVMCIVLRVPVGRAVGRRVELFRPRRGSDGSVRLGAVPHAKTGALRGALIAVAPFVLVPPALFGGTLLLLGETVARDPVLALERAQPWAIAVWAVLAVSAGQAAFPSRGDKIGPLGAALLLVLAGLIVLAGVAGDRLDEALRIAAGVLAPAALAAIVAAIAAKMLARIRPRRY